MNVTDNPVAIITDSASDIPRDKAIEHNVCVIPLNVTFSDGTFSDGIDLPAHAFYERLVSSEEIPMTSQPSPAAFEAAFREKLDAGFDIVCVTLSSGVSGTYQSASLARDLFSEDEQSRIHIVDSLNISLGELLLVRMAIRMRDEDHAASTIANTLEHLRGRVRLVALFDTLKYLHKGGRIPAGVAFVGQMLSIKPVIGVENGKVVILGKARGSKHGQNMVIKMVEKYGGVSYDRPIQFAYSGTSDATLRKYIADHDFLYKSTSEDLPITCVGATIGTHAGPNAIAVAFFSRE